MTIQKNPIKKFKIKKTLFSLIFRFRKLNKNTNNNDLNKTWYLKDAIIDIEWITNPVKGILDGPKYLDPLIVETPNKLGINFFAAPAKLLHKVFFDDNNITSFLVRQQ